MNPDPHTPRSTAASSTLATSEPADAGPWDFSTWSTCAWRPRAAMLALARGYARPGIGWPMWAYLGVTAFLVRDTLFRAAFLWDIAPGSTWRRTSEAVAAQARDDVWLWVAVWGIFWAAGRLLFQDLMSPRARVLVVAALLWPVLVGKVLGECLSIAGWDLWWLPHHPVRSWVIVERGEVMWWRYALKCGVSYGFSAGSALCLLWDLSRSPKTVTFPRMAQIETSESGSASPKNRVPMVPRTAKTVRVVAVFLGFSALALGAWDLAGAADSLRPLLPGDSLPDRTLPLLRPENNRRSISTAALRGKILVLDFWASWCAPCRRSIPEISNGLAERHPEKVVVLGVNQERDRNAAREMWQSLQPRFDSVLDSGDWGQRMGITSLPTTLVVDAQGIVRHVHIGYTELQVLQREITDLLAEAAP